jgi:hypothetical protein
MNTNNIPNAEQSTNVDAQSEAIHGIVDSIVGLGTVWAQHGVEVGRLALKTQSIWLRNLSGLLNQLADSMEPLTRRASEPTAPTDHAA